MPARVNECRGRRFWLRVPEDEPYYEPHQIESDCGSLLAACDDLPVPEALEVLDTQDVP